MSHIENKSLSEQDYNLHTDYRLIFFYYSQPIYKDKYKLASNKKLPSDKIDVCHVECSHTIPFPSHCFHDITESTNPKAGEKREEWERHGMDGKKTPRAFSLFFSSSS
jgi:hypothetical protein